VSAAVHTKKNLKEITAFKGLLSTVGGTSTDEFDFCTLLFGGSPLAE